MRTALIWLATAFGAVCGLIALSHIALGPRVITGSIPGNATMDNEDRFYATLFLGFGMAMMWAARDLRARRRTFDALLAIFFIGGVSRLVSVAAVGWPHPLFIGLGAVELLLPPLFWVWRRQAFGDA